MNDEINLEYTDELMRSAIRLSIFRPWPMLSISVALCLLVFIVNAEQRNIWEGIFWGFCFLPMVLAAFAWWVYRRTIRNSFSMWQKLDNRNMRLVFAEDGVQVFSCLGQNKLKWKLFHALRRFKTVWLLYLNRSQYYILPLSQMDQVLQYFIIKQLKQNGVRIKG